MWIEKLPFVRVIKNFGEIYLVRFTLFRSKKFTAYLHVFFQPDPGRDLHSHPWNWCWAMCLWGGYFERLFRSQTHGVTYLAERFAMGARKFPGETYHTVALLKRRHCVTLFAHGARVREWGFWQRGKHVPWHEYLVAEGINTQEEIEDVRKRYQDE